MPQYQNRHTPKTDVPTIVRSRYDHKMADQPMMIPKHPFVKAVAHALRHRCGIKPKPTQTDAMIVATSGGADSVALLRALAALAQRRTWRLWLVVGHVQHHLRDQAEGDAQFVADLADQLNLPIQRTDLDLSKSPGNLEANARHARYQALADMAQQAHAGYVVTAHHGDDQLETVLMRLLRGSSVRGLAGMAWRRKLLPHHDCTLIRPMLALDHAKAQQFLNDLDQPWRHDHTNTDMSRLRARLRHDVLPSLRDIRPNTPQYMARLTDHLRQTHRLIENAIDYAAESVVLCDKTTTLDRPKARSLPKIVLGGLLQRLLIQAGANSDKLGRRTLDPIVKAIQDTQGGQRHFELVANVRVEVTSPTVRIHND